MAKFDKNTLIQLLLDCQVLRFGEFTLKSGRISPYFFNAGLLSSGQALSQLAAGYATILAQQDLNKNTVIFGAAYKGIPFVAATAQALWQTHAIDVAWGYNRKEVKTHGEGGVLVGADLAGASVWVVDDVMTAGTAIREVAALLHAQKASLAGVVVALDRKEKGQNQLSAMDEIRQEFSVPVYALLDIDDIMAFLQNKGEQARLDKMQAYRAMYGTK